MMLFFHLKRTVMLRWTDKYDIYERPIYVHMYTLPDYFILLLFWNWSIDGQFSVLLNNSHLNILHYVSVVHLYTMNNILQ